MTTHRIGHVAYIHGRRCSLGMDWTNFLGMLAVAIVLLVIGLVQFRYVDVEVG